MIAPRSAFAAVCVAGSLAVTGPSAPAGATPVGGDDVVRSVADEAAHLLADEAELIVLTAPRSGASAAEVATLRARLRSVDARGQAMLIQLRGLGVQLTPAIESALERLPEDLTDPDGGDTTLPPEPVVYAAAITDLERIVATPQAASLADPGPDGPSYRLLLIAAASLVVLGSAGLVKTLRRHPETHEPEVAQWSDPVTGLANRRRFDHDLDARRSAPREMGVIMIDIDRFRLVNDEHGDDVGDQILRRLGRLLAHHVRADDVVYRYGGEEFCVLLPGTDPEQTRMVAERLVQAARGIELPNGANITVSVGVARAIGADVEDAIEHADLALIHARRMGRDRAVTADDIELLAG